MDFIEANDFTDLGAPEYCVTGVASIEHISAEQVRITKYSRRKDGNYVLFYEVWDRTMWLQTVRLIEEARDAIMAEPPPTERRQADGVALQ